MFFTEHFIHFRIVFMVMTDILKTPKSNSNLHMSVTIFAFFHSVEHWLLLAFLMFPSVETVTYFTWRFLIAIYSLSTLVREIPTWYQHERKVWKKIRNKAKDKKTSPHFVEGATIKLDKQTLHWTNKSENWSNFWRLHRRYIPKYFNMCTPKNYCKKLKY